MTSRQSSKAGQFPSQGADAGVATSPAGPPTFRAWLKQQHHRDDPVGDLARDTRADLHCWTGTSWWHLRQHMEDVHGASDLALDALERARQEWEAG